MQHRRDLVCNIVTITIQLTPEFYSCVILTQKSNIFSAAKLDTNFCILGYSHIIQATSMIQCKKSEGAK